MKKNVYFSSLNTNHFNTPFSIIKRLSDIIDDVNFTTRDHVALKIHFGEFGNFNHIKPQYLFPLIEKFKNLKVKVFLTDTNTLYQGMRTEAVEHISCGIKNGFGYDALQVPIIIADGIKGHDYVSVEIDGKYFTEVKVASNIFYADYLVCLSHFKLHDIAGFGGSIKNLGMGCASKNGKYEMHSDLSFKINKRCVGCGQCVKTCAYHAIIIEDKKARITGKCIGCGHCLLACNRGAIQPSFSTKGDEFLKKLVEYAFGVIKHKNERKFFFNFLTNIALICDCVNYTPEILMNDIGIVVSDDPVACDQASIDLLNKHYQHGNDIIKDKYPDVNYELCLDYAEQIGLGSRDYRLIDISKNIKAEASLKLSKIAKNFHKK